MAVVMVVLFLVALAGACDALGRALTPTGPYPHNLFKIRAHVDPRGVNGRQEYDWLEAKRIAAKELYRPGTPYLTQLRHERVMSAMQQYLGYQALNLVAQRAN